MKTIFPALALGLLGLVSTAAYAEGECDKYRTSYDKTYCFGKLFVESDKELNSAYTELRGLIKEPAKSQLKTTQLAWIKHRDASCESAGAINVVCNYKVNRERAEYLRDRVRECKAGTCRDEMIVKPSW